MTKWSWCNKQAKTWVKTWYNGRTHTCIPSSIRQRMGCNHVSKSKSCPNSVNPRRSLWAFLAHDSYWDKECTSMSAEPPRLMLILNTAARWSTSKCVCPTSSRLRLILSSPVTRIRSQIEKRKFVFATFSLAPEHVCTLVSVHEWAWVSIVNEPSHCNTRVDVSLSNPFWKRSCKIVQVRFAPFWVTCSIVRISDWGASYSISPTIIIYRQTTVYVISLAVHQDTNKLLFDFFDSTACSPPSFNKGTSKFCLVCCIGHD